MARRRGVLRGHSGHPGGQRIQREAMAYENDPRRRRMGVQMADIEKRRSVPHEECKRSEWQDQPKEPKITSRHGAHLGIRRVGLHKAREGGLYEAFGGGSQSD